MEGNMVTISRIGAAGETLDGRAGEREAILITDGKYPAGSAIRVTADKKHLWFKADAALEKALLYVPDGAFTYRIPEGAELTAYPPGAFTAARSMVCAAVADDEEIAACRDLALNRRMCAARLPRTPTPPPMWKRAMKRILPRAM
jgi:hypothetical protein